MTPPAFCPKLKTIIGFPSTGAALGAVIGLVGGGSNGALVGGKIGIAVGAFGVALIGALKYSLGAPPMPLDTKSPITVSKKSLGPFISKSDLDSETRSIEAAGIAIATMITCAAYPTYITTAVAGLALAILLGELEALPKDKTEVAQKIAMQNEYFHPLKLNS